MTRSLAIFAWLILTAAFAPAAWAQQPNPVDRKVENPVTDTPYVNPLQQDQPVRPSGSGKIPAIQPGDVLHLDCGTQTTSGSKEALVTVCEGAVDARIGT